MLSLCKEVFQALLSCSELGTSASLATKAQLMSSNVLVSGSPYILFDYIENFMSINGRSEVQTGESHNIYHSYVV